ncbi:hypothetical protein J7E25_07015 [Agromyces sp. ISL-38]|uniref:DUF6264 family protein n=1 Tax=Agromyces sp. ISL-38 TaxID=2819107 RepID=UPI001BE8CDD1|nr:DUF6264 family protein [Agromyces sp. ISL-38]MBT2498842.1 hypothetical protein [Agromyces sp. ISL-38]MBT2516473.1 hypothetical protein [Streptomyces sp. ISL-90]
MSQHGAARSSDESDGGGAARGDAPPAPPRDERPRPQYGEYAPEGWSWQPPADQRTSDPAPQMATPPPPVAASARPDRPADRIVTILLLVLGAFGAAYNSFSVIAMPSSALESARMSAAMFGSDAVPTTFTPGPAVPAAIAIGVAAQLVLWVCALLWSRARLRAGALSWWIPLVAGVVAFVVVMIVALIVFTSDPALLEFLRSVGSPTPAP